jgi:hypothetical protein
MAIANSKGSSNRSVSQPRRHLFPSQAKMDNWRRQTNGFCGNDHNGIPVLQDHDLQAPLTAMLDLSGKEPVTENFLQWTPYTKQFSYSK